MNHHHSKKLLLALSSIMLLAACNGGGENSSASSVVSSQESESSESSESSEVIIPTENLTDTMFASFKKGYSVTFLQSTTYDTDTPSTKYEHANVNDKNYEVSIYYHGESYKNLGTRGYYYHYQTNPSEDQEMLYEAGLSVANGVIYTPVTGTDAYTYQEVDLTWEESYYSNVFQDLKAAAFTRVGTENKWKLDIASEDDEVQENIYKKLCAQLYGDRNAFESAGGIDAFYLLTNGDKISGFELNLETYVNSSATNVAKISTGIFTDSGEDVVDFVKPLEGREKDATFEAAMTKLRNQNYHLEESQSQYSYTGGSWQSLGSYKADFYNKKTVTYEYYASTGKKTLAYGYTKPENEAEYGEGGARLGIVPINGEYYLDYAYGGNMDSLLPSFDLASELFVKDTEASTATKSVYKLDKTIEISTANNDTIFTPFDADGYYDRLVYLTVTIENDTINIHNETSNTGESGLILDCTYTKFGEITDVVTSDKFHETIEGLKWTDLLSNDQEALAAFKKSFTADVLDAIPTVTKTTDYVRSTNIYTETGSKNYLYFLVYDKDEALSAMGDYADDLKEAGFTCDKTIDKTALTTDDTLTFYKNITIKNKTYQLNLEVSVWWNSIQEWGQFQIGLYNTAAK